MFLTCLYTYPISEIENSQPPSPLWKSQRLKLVSCPKSQFCSWDLQNHYKLFPLCTNLKLMMSTPITESQKLSKLLLATGCLETALYRFQFAPVGTPKSLVVDFNLADVRNINGPNIQVLRNLNNQYPSLTYRFYLNPIYSLAEFANCPLVSQFV